MSPDEGGGLARVLAKMRDSYTVWVPSATVPVAPREQLTPAPEDTTSAHGVVSDRPVVAFRPPGPQWSHALETDRLDESICRPNRHLPLDWFVD